MKVQYAEVPIKYLEIAKSSAKRLSIKTFKPVYRFKLSKHNPYTKRKMKSVVVKINLDENPYIEEILTQNKIGLNKKDGYRIYLKGDTIYKLCTKEEAYLKTAEQLNYKEEITRLFNNL